MKWEDVRVGFGLAAMSLVLCFGSIAAARGVDRSAAACAAVGGHVFGSYVDQVRCAR